MIFGLPTGRSGPLLSIAQASDRAGVTRRTIYNWMAAGKVAYMRTAGGSVRIYADSLFRPGEADAPLVDDLPPFPEGPLVVPLRRGKPLGVPTKDNSGQTQTDHPPTPQPPS